MQTIQLDDRDKRSDAHVRDYWTHLKGEQKNDLRRGNAIREKTWRKNG